MCRGFMKSVEILRQNKARGVFLGPQKFEFVLSIVKAFPLCKHHFHIHTAGRDLDPQFLRTNEENCEIGLSDSARWSTSLRPYSKAEKGDELKFEETIFKEIGEICDFTVTHFK